MDFTIYEILNISLQSTRCLKIHFIFNANENKYILWSEDCVSSLNRSLRERIKNKNHPTELCQVRWQGLFCRDLYVCMLVVLPWGLVQLINYTHCYTTLTCSTIYVKPHLHWGENSLSAWKCHACAKGTCVSKGLFTPKTKSTPDLLPTNSRPTSDLLPTYWVPLMPMVSFTPNS